MPETVGYARVSSVGQSLDVQIEKLAECDKLFQEKKSGVDRKRPELARALEYVREGDTLVITRIDRLARSLGDMLDITRELERKGVNLKVIDQSIDTATPAGRAMLQMLGVFAEFETAIRKERQMDGIAKAKADGTKTGNSFGRPVRLDHDRIKRLRDEGMSMGAIAKDVGCSVGAVHKVLNAL